MRLMTAVISLATSSGVVEREECPASCSTPPDGLTVLPVSPVAPVPAVACAHRRVKTAWMVRVLCIEAMPI